MNITLRNPVDADWPSILNAAHASAPWAGDQNQEWFHNRQNFDTKTLQRRHYVVEEDTTKQVIGYGAVEEGPYSGVYRVFVVMSPERLTSSIGQYLYDRLKADLDELNAFGSWVREEPRDTVLLDFFARQGFVETRRATLSDGLEVVILENRNGVDSLIKEGETWKAN